MSDDLTTLWRPLRVGQLQIPNRVMMSAHNPMNAPERYAAYVGERARGGAGLIVLGAVPVHPTSGAAGEFPASWSPSLESDYRQIADAVHAHDCKVVSQLYHDGHQHPGDESLETWHAPLAASAIASPVAEVIAKEIEEEEIEAVIESFAATAAVAQAAGIDGVEVHAAHGYLLHGFLSPLTNRRLDRYGGAPENRARVALEVARAIRQRCGDDYTVGLKVAFDEYVGPAGITPERAVETLRVFAAAAVFDYVSISNGNYHTLERLVAPVSSGRVNPLAEHAAAAKEVVGEEIPVMVTGGVRTLARAAALVAAGADMAGISRGFLADPELVAKGRSGRAGEVRRCVGANQGCWARLRSGLEVTCTVNPMAGRELRWRELAATPTSSPRRVLVIGAGPAGMKAAEAAAQRGHRVTLLEKESELGGQLRLARVLPYADSWGDLVDDLAASLERLGVEVELGVEATASTPADRGAELTIVAAGSTWDRTGFSILRPGHETIPGADGGQVKSLTEAIEDLQSCGERVLVVDEIGDAAPLGLAARLAEAGREVQITTPHSQVGRKLNPTAAFSSIYPRLIGAGVLVRPNSFVDEIQPGAAALVDRWSGSRLQAAADTVVLAIGRSAEEGLYRALKDDDGGCLRVGDCVAPRRVDDATYEGMKVGLEA